jgi:predicted CoA-binding protein
MASNYETFWEKSSYALVGNSAQTSFPEISYGELKRAGKTVYAVDTSVETICGDKAYDDLESLPSRVEGVVLEVPRSESQFWVEKAGQAGVKDVWIHMGMESPEALEAGRNLGINIRHGTCAVLYLKKGFSYHSIHRAIVKLLKKY